MAERTCSEDDCDGAHCARGLCKRHYYLWYDHGGKEQIAPRPVPNGKTKICTGCLKELPLECFPPRAGRNGNGKIRIARCRDCETEQAREWREANREHVNRRTREYRERNPEVIAKNARRRAGTIAGLDKDDVEAYYNSHDGLCDICQRPPKGMRLSVDHDHTTGEFRGLICRKCNSALGYFDDNPDLLRAAVRYFERDIGAVVRPAEKTSLRVVPPRRTAIYPDAPCQDCGVMMQRRSATHKWCDACRERHQHSRKQAAALTGLTYTTQYLIEVSN